MMEQLSASLEKITSHFHSELSGLNIGRANAGLVENIQVESYGSLMPIKSLANISCPDARTIRIEPWDKSLVGAIEKKLQESNIGIMPQNMGAHIFLPIPPMTEDRRKQMVKKVHEMEEEQKIVVRNVRQDFIKKVKTQKENKEISEDEEKRLEKHIQEKVDEINKKLEEMAKKREQEILSI